MTATLHVAVRLSPEDIARIDEIVPQLSTLGRDANRSDALRMLILIGLDRLEKEPPVVPGHVPGKKKRRK